MPSAKKSARRRSPARRPARPEELDHIEIRGAREHNLKSVDVDLPNWAVFHSIFVCPISKEVATPSNPPMMLPCGHALCLSSVAKLARGSRSVRFKCPYCPAEASLAMALELKF